MLEIDLNKDDPAFQQAFNYNTERLGFESEVNELHEGPVKAAYLNNCTYFGTLTT